MTAMLILVALGIGVVGKELGINPISAAGVCIAMASVLVVIGYLASLL